MNEDLISGVIKECTKIFKDIKKKQNTELNTSLDNILNELDSLKDNVIEKNKEKIEENIATISTNFIEGSTQIINLKFSKFFLNILILLKKFIEYDFFSKEKITNVIQLIKEFYNHPKINDECQNKILEILQTLIFTSFFELKYDILSIIYIIILRSFNNTNHSKNKDFKNPIRLLLASLTEKIYKSNNMEIIVQITILIYSWYNLSLKKKLDPSNRRNSQELTTETKNTNNEYTEDIDDKLKEEINLILSQKKNNIYIQCLSLELLSQGFLIIYNKKENEKQDQFDMNFLNSFIKEKILKSLILSVDNIKKNNSTSEDELNYLHYLKLCRLIKIIVFNININYDIIQSILEVINDKNNKIIWKLNLSFEFISKIIYNYDLLHKLYEWNKDVLISIFSTLKDFINNIETLKDDKESKKVDSIISNFIKKKELDNNKIYIEGDEIVVFKEHNKKFYKRLINDCMQNIIDSLIKNNKISEDLKNENEKAEKEIFELICDNLKEVIFKLLSNEMNKNINIQSDVDCDLKVYINYIQNMMELYNNLNMLDKRDEYLKYLCELAQNFPEDKNNDDKNIFIALNLLDLSKTANLLNKDSLVIILQAIEVFNHTYNYVKLNEYAKNDLDKILKDINNCLFEYKKSPMDKNSVKKEDKSTEDENEQKDDVKSTEEKKELEKSDTEKKEDKKEDSKNLNYKDEMRKNLCEGIDAMFIDSKNIDLETLKNIIDALSKCIDLSIIKNQNSSKKTNDTTTKDDKEKEKETKNSNNLSKSINKSLSKSNSIHFEEEKIFNYEIIFYFSKILTLTLLNVDNIYILFDPLNAVINKLVDNKLMIDFSIDILCSLIPEILLKYEKIELNIKKNLNEENKIWVNERWQKLLFSPFLTLLSQPDLYKLIKGKIFIGLNKIIQQSGHFMDLFGWESIIQSCNILSNYDIENTFLSVKQILNDYSIYLTLFNIVPLMKLLQVFIFDENDKNISFSAVELFWSCANLVDDIKQGKRLIKDKQKPIFDNLLKGKEIKVYCDELYTKLFSYLIQINKDSRMDVRKSGLNVFTEIFVSKMNHISSENRLAIVNDIFFKVFSSNADKFIKDKSNSELEQTLETSLLDIIKILKEFFTENMGENKIFENYLNKIIEIIPKGTTSLNTDILKSILEIKLNNNENMPMISTKLDIYFRILILINEYIKSPDFSISKFNKVPTYRLYNGIISYLSCIFCENNKLDIYTDENFKNVFNVLNTLFESVYSIEPKLLEIKPRKLITLEDDIFNFLEKIPVQKNTLLNYIIDKMVLDIKNPHSESICSRAIECFQKMICKNDGEYKFGLKKEEKEIIQKFIEKIKDLINLRNNNEVIECLMNTTLDKNNMKDNVVFKVYLNNFIKIIDEIICNNFSKHKESMEDDKEITEEKKEIINNINEIFLLVLNLFETIFNQSNEGYKNINKLYLPIINEVYQQMEIELVNFIINKFLFYFLFILGNEEQEQFKKVEENIIKIIKLSCDISYDNSNNSSIESLNQICINELFNICKYKSDEEILENIKNEKIKINKDKYIHNHIKIGKICTVLLIQKIIEILKKFREDEIKSGDMPLSRGRIKEIVNLLENIKNLEIFPNINMLEKDEKEEEKKEDITVFDVIRKTKKIHLFYIQPILNDFIDTKEKDIKNLVKDIFIEITNIIGMPKLTNFNK